VADAYTIVSSVNSVQTAYDRLAYFALRKMLVFDQVAEVTPTEQTQPGLTVKFTIWSDLAVASTALNESTDVDAVQLADSQITVTLVEYGNVVIPSQRVKAGSFLYVERDAANIVGYNGGLSQDAIAVNTLKAGTNVRYATGGTTVPTARNTVEPNDTLTGNDVRRARADLRGSDVMFWPDGMYRGFMHPDVSYDFRGATGGANWRDPHTYSSPENVWNGSIGAFEGIEWMEVSTAPVFADAGSSTTLTDVYATIVVGRQALAKAFSSSVSGANPHVVLGPQTDHLRRFSPIGWYWLGGYAIFRQAAVRRIESSSSIGVNA
jgi:N4-gp56 family major capsid protein